MSVGRLALFGLSAIVISGAISACGSSQPSAAPPPPARITTGPFSHVHVLQTTASGSLLLSDQEGVWRRTFDGTWTHTGPPLNRMMATCLAQTDHIMLACTTTYVSHKQLGSPRGVWRTTNGGRSWVRVSLPDAQVTYLATNANVPNTIVAFADPDTSSGNGIGHGGVWISSDAGRLWHRVNSSLATTFAPIGLALLPGTPFTVLFATTAGIHRSTDGGRTWSTSTLGGNPIVAMTTSPIDSRTVYVGASNGIWRSTNAGKTWALFHTEPATFPLLAVGDRPNDLYGLAHTEHPYVYRLRPSGKSSRGTAPRCGGQIVMTVDPMVATRLYYACSLPLRLYESNDAGVHWRKIL